MKKSQQYQQDQVRVFSELLIDYVTVKNMNELVL